MRPGQSYSPLEGALDNYHLIYVIADERDVIGVRVNKRPDEVYFMPINVSKDRAQKMFIDMSQTANLLAETPRFYNTFGSNCTNSIMKDTALPAWQYYLDLRIMLPGYSDRIAYEYGVLTQGHSREDIRSAAYIPADQFNEESATFSKDIRDNFFSNLAND